MNSKVQGSLLKTEQKELTKLPQESQKYLMKKYFVTELIVFSHIHYNAYFEFCTARFAFLPLFNHKNMHRQKGLTFGGAY